MTASLCACTGILAEKADRRTSQWEVLLRKISASYSADSGHNRRSISTSIPQLPRSKKTFPTGSTYEGTWTVLGMSGFGIYTFPSGAIYEGSFDDGMFHGTGKLSYPNGTFIVGTWEKGELIEKQLIFVDGIEYKEKEWEHCQMPDRRYQIELAHGLQPARTSYIAAEVPPRRRTGHGFVMPQHETVRRRTTEDNVESGRSSCLKEQQWIIENCRKDSDNPVGYVPGLYEVFYEPTETLDPTAVLTDDSSYIPEDKKLNEKSLGYTPWTEFHSRGARKL